MQSTNVTILVCLAILLTSGCASVAGGSYPTIRKDESGAVTPRSRDDVERLVTSIDESGGAVRVEIAARRRDDVDRILGYLVGDKVIDQNTIFRSDGSRFFSLEIGQAALDRLIADPTVLEINYLKPPKVRPRPRLQN